MSNNRRYMNDTSTQSYYYDYYYSTPYYYSEQQWYYYYEDKAATGIYGLDQYIGGGLKRGEVYLVAGEAGTGKTIFSLTFLKTGFELGEVGMYVTVDEPSEDVKRGVRDALGWDLDYYEQEGKLLMTDFRTHFRIYAKDEKLTLDPRDLAKMIIEQVKKNNVRRLVIDPIAPLIIMSHQDVLWIREYLRELVFQLKKMKDVTTVMTSEIPTGEATKLSRFGVEEYLASGVIMLTLKEYPNGCLLRVMFIRKMRWMPIRPMKLAFDIGSSGMVIMGPLEQASAVCQQQGYYDYYYYQPYSTQQYYQTQ